MLWIEVWPLEGYVEVPTPGPVNVASFGNRDFTDIIELKSYGVRVSPNPI